MKIHLIHGIHTSETNGTIQHLEPYIEKYSGLEVQYHRYGYALALTTRFLNPSRARKIAKDVEDGDICIGHSNGCALIYEIMQQKNLSGAVLINAALETDISLPNSLLKWVHVYYNEGDAAIPLTEIPFLRRIFFDRPWGEMGKYGYKGKPDPRIKNIDCGHPSTELPPVEGHTDLFLPEKLYFWGPYIGRRIKSELDSA